MIITPTPFFGRGPIYRGPIRHVAMAQDADLVNNVTVASRIHYRVSADARHWTNIPISGDLKSVTRASEPGGAFVPATIRHHQGALYAGGTATIDTTRHDAIYQSRDGRKWRRMSLPSPASDHSAGIVSIAAYDTFVAAANRSGTIYYTTDEGETWARRSDLPVGPAPRHVNGIAASEGGFILFGRVTNGDGTPGSTLLMRADDPSDTFSSVSHPSAPNGLDGAVAGNVMLISKSRVPSTPTLRFMWSELDDLTTWTNADLSSDQFIDLMLYSNNRWHAGSGFNNVWFTSPMASQVPGKAGWGAPSEKPWPNDYPGTPAVFSGFAANGQFVVTYGGNSALNPAGIGVSDDGLIWTSYSAEDAGLVQKPHILGSFNA